MLTRSTLALVSPQDPAHINAEAGNVAGDNDPVDVVEIGSVAQACGAVVPVRPNARPPFQTPDRHKP